MKENESALYSTYIIDGAKCDATPAELLEECMEYPSSEEDVHAEFGEIVDESTEPPLTSFRYDNSKNADYISELAGNDGKLRPFRMLYPEHFTRMHIAKCLIDRLWNEGHFRLGNLRIIMQWAWNTRHVGNMAAFYRSVESAGEYLYELGVKLQDYSFEESDNESLLAAEAWLPATRAYDDDDARENDTPEEILFKSSPYESRHPYIEDKLKCPATLVYAPESWLIYIPFDTCSFKLGGSLLAQSEGHNGGAAPKIEDPDYFIDCYEVMRELVEDGFVMSGTTVADGGLASAARDLCGKYGIEMDLSGITESYRENDTTRILFAEVPGVLIQISDENYDYVDSQFLLQDVAYYPIGHPTGKGSGIRIADNGRSGVADILASLLGQASEGED